MPLDEFEAFQEHLDHARQMASTSIILEARLTNAIDMSDLLRAALVQGVSAFDHFIHEEVRVRMLLMHASPPSNWPSSFSRFSVPLEAVNLALAGATSWLDQQIREQHGYLSFQHPEKVAKAMKLVSTTPLWSTVANDLGLDAGAVRRRLALIVDRRNKIAHEADYDPTPPPSRYAISHSMVDESLNFLESLASSISRLV